jgi:Tfp pilus assembly protein PilW
MRGSAAQQGGFTLAEVLIATVGSVIIVGALLAGSIGLQKSFHASETYAESQADERRLVDYVGRDLRRSIGIAVLGSSGIAVKLSASAMQIDGESALVVTLPAYYKSNAAEDAEYDQSLPIIAAGDRVTYGTTAGPASAFSVAFRKLFLAGEKCVCFVREEDGARQIIVRHAEDLQLTVTVASDGESCSLAAQFASTFSNRRAPVAVYDEVMLRNVRID